MDNFKNPKTLKKRYGHCGKIGLPIGLLANGVLEHDYYLGVLCKKTISSHRVSIFDLSRRVLEDLTLSARALPEPCEVCIVS
jgi:hypothetical protein